MNASSLQVTRIDVHAPSAATVVLTELAQTLDALYNETAPDKVLDSPQIHNIRNLRLASLTLTLVAAASGAISPERDTMLRDSLTCIMGGIQPHGSPEMLESGRHGVTLDIADIRAALNKAFN